MPAGSQHLSSFLTRCLQFSISGQRKARALGPLTVTSQLPLLCQAPLLPAEPSVSGGIPAASWVLSCLLPGSHHIFQVLCSRNFALPSEPVKTSRDV